MDSGLAGLADVTYLFDESRSIVAQKSDHRAESAEAMSSFTAVDMSSSFAR